MWEGPPLPWCHPDTGAPKGRHPTAASGVPCGPRRGVGGAGGRPCADGRAPPLTGGTRASSERPRRGGEGQEEGEGWITVAHRDNGAAISTTNLRYDAQQGHPRPHRREGGGEAGVVAATPTDSPVGDGGARLGGFFFPHRGHWRGDTAPRSEGGVCRVFTPDDGTCLRRRPAHGRRVEDGGGGGGGGADGGGGGEARQPHPTVGHAVGTVPSARGRLLPRKCKPPDRQVQGRPS